MMRFDVRGDIGPLIRDLSRHSQKLVPEATVKALNNTAKFVEDKAIEEMNRAFDRPTRYTKRAIVVRRATLARMFAEVKIKDDTQSGTPPVKYLDDQIYGGRRAHKPFENLLIKAGAMPPGMYAIPAAGAEIDGFGNMKPGQISAILSDLQARRDVTQNASAASRKRRLRSRTRRATFYFSTWPMRNKVLHLTAGIYKRLHFGYGTAIKPVLIFTRAPRYRHRYRFFETADQVARMRFPLEFTIAMRKAIAESNA